MNTLPGISPSISKRSLGSQRPQCPVHGYVQAHCGHWPEGFLLAQSVVSSQVVGKMFGTCNPFQVLHQSYNLCAGPGSCVLQPAAVRSRLMGQHTHCISIFVTVSPWEGKSTYWHCVHILYMYKKAKITDQHNPTGSWWSHVCNGYFSIQGSTCVVKTLYPNHRVLQIKLSTSYCWVERPIVFCAKQ